MGGREQLRRRYRDGALGRNHVEEVPDRLTDGYSAAARRAEEAVESVSDGRLGKDQPVALIMPAPTVTPVASSIRMNDPVVRFVSYGSQSNGTVVRSWTRPIS